MGKDVHNQYYFYPGNAISLIDVTSFIKKYKDGTKPTVTGKELKKRVMYSCN